MVQLTIILIVLTAVGLALYDIYAAYHYGYKGTISWVIYSSSIRWPIIPFLFGLLMGHFFGGMNC